mgnify:CR=1 FL=1
MRVHHFVKEIHQRLECPYCKNDLSENRWNSSFHIEHHYKMTGCEQCGREISIKVNFNGSGHDCWDKNSDFCKLINQTKASKPLEEKIKEIK